MYMWHKYVRTATISTCESKNGERGFLKTMPPLRKGGHGGVTALIDINAVSYLLPNIKSRRVAT